MLSIAQPFAAALASLAVAGAANAATLTLDLTGSVANGAYGTYNAGSVTVSTWTLPLGGLDSTNGPTVSQGDQIEGVLTLDQPFTVTIPPSNLLSFFQITLDGAFPAGDTMTSGAMTLYNGATEVAQESSGGFGSGNLVIGAGFQPKETLKFDTIDFSYTASQLSGPATLTSATFETIVPSVAVPEPATWTLMLLGVGAVGGMARASRGRVISRERTYTPAA